MKKNRIISCLLCTMLIMTMMLNMAVSAADVNDDTIEVTSIAVYADNGGSSGGTVLVGESIYLRASIQPANATNRSVTWSTSNSNIAKVSNGVITTHGKGTAIITATSVSGNYKASYSVTVVDENATYEYNGTTYDYVWEKGTWGSNIKWYHCVGNKLIIIGSGDMKEPGHPIEIPWRNIDPLSVEIQEGITSLCGSALEGLGNATVLKLPSTIKKTGQNTFYVFGKQLNVNGVTYFGGTTYYGGTPDQYNEIDFGYHPFGGLPYKIEYCRASGHIESVSEPVAPTCRSYGKTIGVNCEQCGKEIVKSTQVDYIDCIYEDGYCTMCGIADPNVYVTSVNIPIDSYVLELNESISINATVSPENATNQKIIWRSSNSEIAAISANGIVTGKLLGRVTITATSEDGNKSDTCIVTVVEPTVPVSSISLNKSELEIQIGETETLVATVLPTNATNKSVTWTTSNENVVSVQNGTLTAKETGDAIITVTTTDAGYSDTCYVSVIEPIVNVTGIELSITSEEIYQGVSIPIQAIITPENATNKEIIWTSSNENIVVVDRSGEHTNAHAVAVGTATITATTVDGNKSAECVIVVKERKPSSGSGDSNDDEEEPGGELTLKRGSMCAKIVEAFGFELTEQVEESSFSDIDETDKYYEEILICSQLEIVSGYDDGTFKPNGTITNAEVAKLIYSTLSYIGWSVEIPEDADYDKTMWYGQYAWLVEALGIMINIDDWFAVASEESITPMLGSIGYVYQKRISETTGVNQYVLEVGNYIALKDNEEIECNCAPILNEGTIFASIRSFADILNLAVEYNGETKEVTFIGWEKILKYTVGDENCVVINGATYVNAELIFTEIIGENYGITTDEEKLIATKKVEIEENTYINLGNATARKGQEITIPISISNNTGLTGLQFECNYDDVLTLTNVEVGTALNGLNFTTPGDLTANPVTLLWDGIEADKSNGEILILTFKVDDNVEIGDYDISMTVKSAIDQDLNDVDLKIKGGTISIVEYIPGDVDENGEVNSRDIVLTRRFVAGGYGASILEVAADVDANGDVNSRDIVLMRRYIAGGYGVVFK